MIIANDDLFTSVRPGNSGPGPDLLYNDINTTWNGLRVITINGTIVPDEGEYVTAVGKYGKLSVGSHGFTNYSANQPAIHDLAPGQVVFDVFTYTAGDGILTDDAIIAFKITGSTTYGKDLEIQGFRYPQTDRSFESAEGQIYLHANAFDELGDGAPDGAALKARNFAMNSDGEATRKVAQVIYDTSDGRLLYDADGKGGDDARLFATLGGAPKISVSDFELI